MKYVFVPNEQIADAMTAVRFIVQPWNWYKGKEINNVKRRIKSRFFSTDTSLSFYFSGRGALHQYAKALQLAPGDHVLLTPTSNLQTALALHELGLEISYIDCSDDLSMSVSDLEKKFHPACKLLVLEHPYGVTPQDRKAILAFAKSQKIPVLEDVRAGFDVRLFKNKRYTSSILWSFDPHSMISSVYGALIAVRGKKNTSSLKEVEKNIPQPSFFTLLKILLFKIGSVTAKKTSQYGIGRIIAWLCTYLSIFPPQTTRKEQNGSFDHYFLRIFPNVCAALLTPQLDRFNDVMAKRTRTLRFIKTYDTNPVNSDNSAVIHYPFLIHDNNRKLNKAHLQRYVMTPKNHIAQLTSKKHITKYKPGSCPNCELLLSKTYLISTDLPKQQKNDLKKLLSPS